MAISSRADVYKDYWQRRTRRHGASLRWQRNQAARLRRRQDARNPEFTDPRQWTPDRRQAHEDLIAWCNENFALAC